MGVRRRIGDRAHRRTGECPATARHHAAALGDTEGRKHLRGHRVAAHDAGAAGHPVSVPPRLLRLRAHVVHGLMQRIMPGQGDSRQLVVPDFVCGLRHHVLHMPGPGRPPGRDHTAARLLAPLPPELHLPVAPRRAALPAVQRQHKTVVT